MRPGISQRTGNDARARARLTEALAELGASDGACWSDPAEVVYCANQHERLIVEHIPSGFSVMDLGTSVRRLVTALPPGGKYLTVGLVRFTSSGEILDLNQGHCPELAVDVVVVELLQYIHNIPALLQRCTAAMPNLIVSYPFAAAGDDFEVRCAQRWFNDFDEDAMTDMLTASRRQITTHQLAAESEMFVCHRDIRKLA